MINVSVYKAADGLITGFKLSGHALFSEYGSDIVCAAVSALVINTINSIENFTSDKFHLEQDENKGIMEFHVITPMSNNTNLLLSSLALGLEGIAQEYTDKYIRITQVKSQ
jgi:uncharacterized protein YsxB (DUF464 family)